MPRSREFSSGDDRGYSGLIEESGCHEPWRVRSVAALSLACVLWAGSAIAAKVALGDGSDESPAKIGPLLLACVRFAGAGLLLMLYLRARHALVPVERSDRRRLVALGAFGIAATYAVFYGGMRYTSATETTFLVAAEPILIALLARVLLRERLSRLQGLGMAAGLAGVYVIVFRGIVPTFEGTVAANTVVTLALVFESYASILGKDLVRRYDGLSVAAYGMVIGSVCLLPLAIWEASMRVAWRPGWPEIAAVVYLTVLCSALAYGIWYSLLRRHSVSSMAGFLYIQPVLGPVFAYLLLGERMSVWTFVGAAATLAGVSLIALPERKRRPASSAP